MLRELFLQCQNEISIFEITDGSASNINDHFEIEAGGTDGSATNAGDNLLLEDTTEGSAESVELSAITDRSGTSGQLLTSAGAFSAPTFTTVTAGFTQGTAVDATGTAITFGSIPAGVNMVVLSFHDFSTSGADEMMVQIGDAGGIETADYRSFRGTNTNGSMGADGTNNSNESIGFGITVDGAGNTFGGSMILTLHKSSTFTWVSQSQFRRDNFDYSSGAGSKALSAELTQLRLTTKGGSETFDGGTVNIMFM